MIRFPRSPILIALLWLVGLLAGMQFAKISVLLPEFSAIYPSHGAQLAWLLTLVSIVGAVFGVAAGAIANRFGQKHVLVLSLLFAGLLSLWQSTFPDFAVMAGSRILEGVTHLGIVVTVPAMMAHLSPDRWRGAVLALWSTFFGVSFAAFAWFGLPLVEQIGMAGLFQSHGLAMIVMGIITYLVLPDTFQTRSELEAEADAETRAPLRDAYKDATLIWPALAWLFYTLNFLALLTILPLQMPDAMRSQLTAAMSVVGIGVSLLIVPVLLTRLRATTVVMTGFACAAGVVALGLGIPPVALAILLFGALGLVQGSAFATVAEFNRSLSKRTLGYGLIAQAGNIGNLVGTPLLLFALEHTDQKTFLILICATYCVALLCLAGLLRHINRSRQWKP